VEQKAANKGNDQRLCRRRLESRTTDEGFGGTNPVQRKGAKADVGIKTTIPMVQVFGRRSTPKECKGNLVGGKLVSGGMGENHRH